MYMNYLNERKKEKKKKKIKIAFIRRLVLKGLQINEVSINRHS